MPNLKFLILLCYYKRPKMVLNALNSLSWQGVDNNQIHLAFVDDSGPDSYDIKNLLENINCSSTLYTVNDTAEVKIQQGGSRFGSFWNTAINTTDADIALMLCDDDALYPNYLCNLQTWFVCNPQANYCHSFVAPFDPFTQVPPNISPQPFWLNHDRPIAPSCVVDASQVAWRISSMKADNIKFPEIQTRNLDASLYGQMHSKWGDCYPTKFIGQFKAVFGNALSNRSNDWEVIDLP